MDAAELHYEMVHTRGLTFEVSTHGRGDKLALLLHGFPETAHCWRYQIPLLERLGYRVWAPNMRGYGRSDKPRGRAAYRMDHLEQDVTDLIDASGARSVLLMGHDWGGGVAWSYASYGERPIERLAIMNSPHPAIFQRELMRGPQLLRSWYMLLFQLPWLPERMLRANDYAALVRGTRGWAINKQNFSDRDMDVLREGLSQPGALTAMLNYYRAMPSTVPLMLRRGARKIRVPTLLLWAELDRALGKELTAGTERFVDKLRLEFVPNASHWVQQDAPEVVNRALEAWLASPAG
ncbi:MAG: alpha/beta fold hydrolase [Myxococcales bacterium]